MQIQIPNKGETRTHREYVTRIVRDSKFISGAEIGLGSGKLASMVLQNCPELTYYVGVDIGNRREWRDRHLELRKEYKGRFRLIHSPSITAADAVGNGTLQFIFIDAGHGYGAVKMDIAKWWPKLMDGGLFFGHDYHPKFPGVKQAVREAYGPNGYEVIDHYIWRKL